MFLINFFHLFKTFLCKILGASKQSYNYLLRNDEKATYRYDKNLLEVIHNVFYERRESYGYRRITVLLNKRNVVVSEKNNIKIHAKTKPKSKNKRKKKTKRR